LLLVLALVLVRGVLYVVLLPPWQHYDEPTHFEYVQLIAQRGRLPNRGDYDLEMRREIAASMRAANFWPDSGGPTLDNGSSEPPNIGFSELEHPPLYYALLALPQKLILRQTVETQLYLARLTSLLLYLAVVLSGYGVVAEALPHRRYLSLVVATFMALLPPLTDLMSAVNNDAAAAAAVSLLLWACLRLIRRGPTPGRVAIVLLLVAASFLAKRTAGFVALMFLMILTVTYVPRSLRPWLWRVVFVLLPVTLLALFTFGGHAAYWRSESAAASANRLASDSVHGRSVFVLSTEDYKGPHSIFQELPLSQAANVRGQTVTLGTWLMSPTSSDDQVRLELKDGTTVHSRRIAVTDDWQFHSFTATIGLDVPGLAVRARLLQDKSSGSTVYLDGLVLTGGDRTGVQAPDFDTVQATSGKWGSDQFTNLLRNGSAERAWPAPRNWVGNMRLYRYPVSHIFHSVWDWQRTGWAYGPELRILLQSFWGGFGWNHLSLPSAYLHLLGVITLASMVGTGVGAHRWLKSGSRREQWQWRAFILLGIALIIGWGAAILRIHPLFTTVGVVWPVARYATVVIVPSALFLCYGLSVLVPDRWQRDAAWVGLLAMLALDTVALWTVLLPYYYG
jgi:hypothetical protein